MMKFVAAVALVAVGLAGCGGSDSGAKTPTPGAAASSSVASATAPGATSTAPATATQGVAATATSAATAPAATATSSAPQPRKVTIQLGDASYIPNELTIRAGDTVEWLWGGGIPHSVTSRGGFPSDPAGIKASGSYAFTFGTPGVYQFFCQVHEASGMTGQITVR
jgi:plastocyanin